MIAIHFILDKYKLNFGWAFLYILSIFKNAIFKIMIKNIKYIIVILILIFIGLNIYWYYNPTIDNKDFDLEFKISNEGMDFYKERNKKIDIKNFTFNDERYLNNIDKYELIIHSLDIIQRKERIIIVCNDLTMNNNFKIANITYKDETGKYSPLKIKNKNDSIFIIQQIGIENNLIFKGIKLSKPIPNAD
ncbi:MAG TPA: hypothetical protein DCR77_08750 [Flavobacteriaceae bacterium]|nr:hypothetical protein [Flavobacteriaceae bacterium]